MPKQCDILDQVMAAIYLQTMTAFIVLTGRDIASRTRDAPHVKSGSRSRDAPHVKSGSHTGEAPRAASSARTRDDPHAESGSRTRDAPHAESGSRTRDAHRVKRETPIRTANDNMNNNVILGMEYVPCRQRLVAGL